MEEVKPSLLIADNNDSRREALSGAFQNIADVFEAFRRGDGMPEMLSKNAPDTFLLALRHFGERDVFSECPAVLNVYYGGHGSGDPRRRAGDSDVVARPIESETAALTSVEAAQLLAYAQARAANNYPERPSVLCEKYLRYLPALVYLCQSYLGAWAGFRGAPLEQWRKADPAAALEKMGWNRLTSIKSAPPLAVFTPTLDFVREVEQPSWWAGHLGLTGAQPDWERFRRDCEYEGHMIGHDALPADVTSGIGILQTNPVPPSEIVRMYLALAKLMDTKPCH